VTIDLNDSCSSPKLQPRPGTGRFWWSRREYDYRLGVQKAERAPRQVQPDDKGILQPRYDDHPCLEIRVSKGALERALAFMNAVILFLEAEGFPVAVRQGKYGTGAQIFGYRVTFAIVEKLREKSRREVKEYS
jgi:hypothetical protein